MDENKINPSKNGLSNKNKKTKNINEQLANTMKKYRVLQLGLQLGFSSCNGHLELMLFI